jgi:pSer/pThr/pTyr-binding forkhead associated (FHA) protein
VCNPRPPSPGTTHESVVIVVFHPDGKGSTRFELDQDSILIGLSDPEAGIVPDLDLAPFQPPNAATISRRHARLYWDDQALYLEDLNSTNGTRVNGARVSPDRPMRIMPGSTMNFGPLAARYHCGPSVSSTLRYNR